MNINAEIRESQVQSKFEALRPVMDERMRRLWAGAEAREVGYGGVQLVARATGLSRTTIANGIKELDQSTRKHEQVAMEPGRIRRPGAGRKPLTVSDPALAHELDELVEPGTRGDPQAPLRWTCKSTRRLATELAARGHPASPQTVGVLLHAAGYSLQGNRKTVEGASHPDRDAQFRHISLRVRQFQRRGQPVVSVDTKKKELVGNFKNAGREWHRRGGAPRVRVHDFPEEELGRAIPYGVYDLAANQGWVSVGTDHDTSDFAVETLRRWWRRMGKKRYPKAKALMVTADSGGSNGYRTRAWKVALQRLADETGLSVSVSHFPPGTSKWNKIEHRMFCHITRNWRGRPLVSYRVIVSLIGRTTTQAGLRIRVELDENRYPKGVKISDEQLAAVRVRPDVFHGDWNYTVVPRSSRRRPRGT